MVEKAGEGGSEEIRRGVGEVDDQLRVGGGLEDFGAGAAGFGAADEDEFWGLERGERGEEVEALVKEEADGEEVGARVGESVFEDVGVGVVEDDGGDRGVVWVLVCSERKGE